MDDQPKAWLRQTGEPDRWFRRFERYRRMGPNRSLLGCLNREQVENGRKKTTDVPGAWRSAFDKWHWAERAGVWDDHIAQREEQEWEEKRRKVREQEWDLAQALIDKAKQMLVFPLAATSREQEEQGGKVVNVTTVKPARWSMRDIPAMIKTADDLVRLAAEMANGRIEVDWRDAARDAGLDPDAVFDEVVKKLVAQYGSRPAVAQPDDASGNRGGQAPGSGTGTVAPGGGAEADGLAASPHGGA